MSVMELHCVSVSFKLVFQRLKYALALNRYSVIFTLAVAVK